MKPLPSSLHLGRCDPWFRGEEVYIRPLDDSEPGVFPAFAITRARVSGEKAVRLDTLSLYYTPEELRILAAELGQLAQVMEDGV